jgi:hypothetical protein
MNGAVVWYQSRAVLALIATIVIAGAKLAHLTPAWLTQDSVVDFLFVAIPAAVALEARISATRVVVATPSKAAAVNAATPAPAEVASNA